MASSKFKRFMIPGAMVIGGVTAGSMLAPVGFAAAADDTIAGAAEDTAGSTVADGEGRRNRRGHQGHLAHHHHPVAEDLTETLDMTVEELQAAFADGKSLADIASEQGASVDELEAALIEAATERIDEAVADDRIDADRAAELKADLDERIGEMINRTPGDGQGPMGDGQGPKGDGQGPGRRNGNGRGGPGGGEVAEFLGLSTDDLRAVFGDGQTLAEVAETQGVSEDDLVAFLLEQAEERLDQAVENGRLDADDAEAKLAGAAERIEEHINAEPGERRRPGGRP